MYEVILPIKKNSPYITAGSLGNSIIVLSLMHRISTDDRFIKKFMANRKKLYLRQSLSLRIVLKAIRIQRFTSSFLESIVSCHLE